MFKLFVIFVGSAFFIGLTYIVISKFYRYVKRVWKEKNDRKNNEIILDEDDARILDFEDKLFGQYKNICFNLLKKQIQASKVMSEIRKNIDDYKEQAKKCKILYVKTDDNKYKENAYLFLHEIDDLQKLCDLADKTIKECKIKIDTAEIEYKTLIGKIRNKQLEYKLIGDDADRSFIDKDMYEKILSDYTEKIDMKRIDNDVNEVIASEKKLSAAKEVSIDNNELREAYEKRFDAL